MTRLSLLLATLCAVQVLAISRVRRAVETTSKAETAANNTGPTGGSVGSGDAVINVGNPLTASSAAPARRAYDAQPDDDEIQLKGYEYKDNPKDLNRARGKDRETSSSSGERDNKTDEEEADKDSMGMQDTDSTSDAGKNKNKKDLPKSTEERHGWKKWHRKCYKCPEEMRMKWRDPRIKWVCGAYQRARRSFKSLCMMRYRNCQDGTMFVMIHLHRCANSTADDSAPHGEHFFYDYKAPLSDDSSGSKKDSESSSDVASSSSSE